MVNLCLARGEDVRGHISNSQRALVTPRAFYAFLFCAQLSAATTSALSIGSVVLFGRNDIPNVSVVLVFDVLRSVLSVLGILCTMSAYLCMCV
jgi:hypothetical protein